MCLDYQGKDVGDWVVHDSVKADARPDPVLEQAQDAIAVGGELALEVARKDLADAFFLRDPDVIDALVMWRRKFYSDTEMTDRLKYCGGRADFNARSELTSEPFPYDDEHAAPLGIA